MSNELVGNFALLGIRTYDSYGSKRNIYDVANELLLIWEKSSPHNVIREFIKIKICPEFFAIWNAKQEVTNDRNN